MSTQSPDNNEADKDARWMRRAIEVAKRGQGYVEPNPMVGCVIVRDDEVLAEGWHKYFGGPHAERDAIASAGDAVDLSGATWYVTLEPCCHSGKTPPCSGAVIASRPSKVVVAMRDPHPLVNGGGLREMHNAGIQVVVGVEAKAAANLCAPFLHRLKTGRPWVIAKWAMTLDGKIATHQGDSRWISGPESRERVHQLRGRLDAIIVGAGTALADDPRLTVRPPGIRTPVRIVVDRFGRLPADSQLARTARETPVRLFVGPQAGEENLERLQAVGVEVIRCQHHECQPMCLEVLEHCGRANMTNVLVEGGGGLLGTLNDAGLIDEVHAFVCPRIIGGQSAVTPIAGQGLPTISSSKGWRLQAMERVSDDVMLIVRRPLDDDDLAPSPSIR